MRHGYYLPTSNQTYGDAELAAEAKRLFDRLELPLDSKGKYQGGKYDGCSIFLRDHGTSEHMLVRRLILEDFFCEQFRVLTYDI